jgi:hypothetical protein
VLLPADAAISRILPERQKPETRWRRGIGISRSLAVSAVQSYVMGDHSRRTNRSRSCS